MPNIADIVAANLESLMEDRAISSDNALAKLAGVNQKTVWRILNKRQSPTVGTMEKLAKPFGLQAWQLLIPGLDPKNPPVFAISDSERKFYQRLSELATEFVTHEHPKKYGQ